MSTALTLYPTSANSSTLIHSELMVTVGGASGGIAGLETINSATGWGEIGLGASPAWASAGSIGVPSGQGAFYDGGLSALTGKQIVVGNWSATINLSIGQASKSVVGTLTLRFYKYNTSTTTYTAIGSITLSTQTVTSTVTAFNFPVSSLPAMSFGSNESVYCDLWMNITSNNQTSGGSLGYSFSNSSTLGWSGSQINTPGFVAPVTKSVPIRAVVRSQKLRSLAVRTVVRSQRLRSLAIRTITTTTTARLKSLPIRASIGSGAIKSFTLRSLIATAIKQTIAIRTVVIDPNASYVVAIDGQRIEPSFEQQQLCLIAGSLTIDGTIGKRSTASFSIHSDNNTHFQQYQQVEIYDKANVLAFSGYITQPKETKPGWQPTLNHQISCVDQHFLADKRVVAATFTNKTCGFLAKWLVDNVLAAEGVTIGQIYDGPVPSPMLYPSPTLYPGGNVGIIPECTFVYCSVAQALDSLVVAASTSGVPYYWSIDQYKRLWFVPYVSVVNTTVVDGSSMEQGVNPPSVTRQNPSYRNTQYVLGGVAQTLSQTETRMGDGNTTAWTMGYALSLVPTVKVNSTSKTVGIKGVDSGKDFYWNKGDATITQDNAGTKLATSDTLQVTYIGQYPTVIIAQDASQVAYQSDLDKSTGIVESVQQDATITSAENGMSLASQLINHYAQQALQLQFTTRDSRYSQGQLITVNLPDFALENAQMLISDVSASDQTDGLNIYFTITAIQGPYDIGWQDFFATMLKQQQPPDAINIGVSQTLTIAATMSANTNTVATFTITVLASVLPGPTVYPSTTLYPA